MPKKLTIHEFLEKCKFIHGDKYDYGKTIYKNQRTKIIVTCKIHGDFLINPYNHIHLKSGCIKCSISSHKLTYISDDRLKTMIEVHSNKYEYIDRFITNGKINIICPSHGEFSQSIYNHERGHGCYKCEKESRIKIRMKTCRICKVYKCTSDFYLNYSRCKECCDNKVEFKICSKCGVEKIINEFDIRKDSSDGHRNECKDCFKLSRSKSSKKYKSKNKDILRIKNREYHKKRILNDSFYRAKIDARNIIRKALSGKGYSKDSKTEDILGCSYEKFKEHIESQFVENMTWDNRNEWHIDHIIPIDFAINIDELLKLNNYLNLRPLYIKDNRKKWNSITIKNDIYNDIVNCRIKH